MKLLIVLLTCNIYISLQAQVTTIHNFLAEPSGMFTYNGEYYFPQRGSGTGLELWKTNGTAAGTSLVKDILSGTGSSSPSLFYKLNNKVIFSANYDATKRGLFVTDGTTAGTNSLFLNSFAIESEELAEYQGNLYGLFIDAAYSSVNLVKTNGTTTEVLVNIPGVVGTSAYGRGENFKILSVINNRFIFMVNDATACYIYTSDGTAAGTQIASTISVPAGAAFDVGKIRVTTLGTDLFFTLSVNNRLKQYLYKLNGINAQSTLLFTDNDANSSSWQYMGIRFIMNNEVYFVATIAGEQRLYKTDGTIGGTVLVKGFGFNGSVSFFNGNADRSGDILVQGNTCYFVTNEQSTIYTLWKTDGTTNGTFVAGVAPTSFRIDDLFFIQNNLYVGTRTISGTLARLYLMDEAAGTVTPAATQTGDFGFQYASTANENICGRSIHSFHWRFARYDYQYLPNTVMPELDKYGISFSMNSATAFQPLAATPLFSQYTAVSNFYKNGSGYLFFGLKPTGYELAFMDSTALSCSALPVQFTGINAVWINNKAVVTWYSTAETEVAYYEVQKETANAQWKAIKKVSAKNQLSNTYQCADENVLPGINLYRVMSKDKDGSVKYSHIVSLKGEHPEQVRTRLINSRPQVMVTGIRGNHQVQVLSAEGKLVAGFSASVNAWIDIPATLVRGVYIIRAVTGNKSTVLVNRLVMP
jgi:ELWxxDGT repeat protein